MAAWAVFWNVRQYKRWTITDDPDEMRGSGLMQMIENKLSKASGVTYHDLSGPQLEPVPAKSPHRKYLVLVALHMVHSDDPDVLCEAADCSERTLHYVKSRLRDHDGVVFNHDRNAKRYFVIETGVLDLPKVAQMMRKLYPKRFAYIQELGKQAAVLEPIAEDGIDAREFIGQRITA